MSVLKKIVAALIVVLLLWGSGLAGFSFFSLRSSAQDAEQTTDAIVVLTGGKNRIETGLALFAAGRSSQLFITGVNENVTKKEILALWGGKDALPACCVTLGYEARSTVQNAHETRAWLEKTGFRSIRMVTGDYHMIRAQMEMGHALPNITIYAHPVKQDDLKINTELLRNLLVSEYHKSLYRWIILLVTPRHDIVPQT